MSDVGKPAKRILLSPPHADESDITSVVEAMRSGWLAPLGPEVERFEAEVAAGTGREFAVALSSGTAGLHLALLAAGVGAGDEVVVPTLTFAATAFAVTYTGAMPVFLDVEEHSWNLDADLLGDYLESRLSEGRMPGAVISVDLFGRPANYDRLDQICRGFGVPLIVDAAEALGAEYRTGPAGSVGLAAVFSFNGNKIITTSGGGMLVTDEPEVARRVRKWATQSREPLPWYEHTEIGFNYRMSNILAAFGRSQFARISSIVEARRSTRDRYFSNLSCLEGVTLPKDPTWGRWNGWLTTVRFDERLHEGAASRVRAALEDHDVESRPIWKPMHMQPVFNSCEAVSTGVASALFTSALCLPSGTSMTNEEVDFVSSIIKEQLDS